ncbi:MAG: DUF4402 domain-containing protein [Marinagarivorans sp.]|nr:DUF4402 domain-containing protein [Marinagarivorans sp.]
MQQQQKISALSFGQFAIGTNNAESTLVISKRGGTTLATYRIYPLAHGQPGHYLLTAYLAFTPLIITIPPFDITRSGSQALRIENFDFDPVITDGSGAALLIVGATLKTNGAGGTYGDGNYTGVMNITINW